MQSFSDNESESNFPDVDPVRCQSIGCIDEEAWKKLRWSTYLDEDEMLDLDIADDNDRYGRREDGDISTPLTSESYVLQTEGFPGSSYPPQEVSTTGVCSVPDFHHVVKDLLVKGHADSHPPENLLLEVKSYKFAQNRDFSACAAAAIDAVLHVAWPDEEKVNEMAPSDTVGMVSSVKEVIQEWKPLLSALGYSIKEELAMVRQLERMTIDSSPLVQISPYILQLLYHMDVVSEDALLEWAEEQAAKAEGSDGSLLDLFNAPKTQEFISWLREEEEESDEEDDECEE